MTRRLASLAAALLVATAVAAQSPEPPPTPAPVEPTPAPTQPAPTPPPPPPPTVENKGSWKQKLFFGGGVGASFGTIDYVSISPMIGYHVIPRFDVGLQPFYSYTKDDRYVPEFSASNYGADVFARFRVFRGLFAEGRYEWISYEYRTLSGGDDRTSDTYPMLGAGWSMGMGKVGGYVSVLYNFGYDDADPFRPYDSPWIYQVGVSAGF